MKVVLLGNTKLKYSWWYLTHRQGLERNGVEVFDIDYKSNPLQNIKEIILGIKPDYVFEHLSFHPINPIDNVLQMTHYLKNQGIKFVHFVADARTHDRYMGDLRDTYYMGFASTYPMVKNCSEAWGIPVHYSPYSSLCYDEMAEPVDDLRFHIPIFTGSPLAHRTGWKDDRATFIEKLASIMPIKMFQTQGVNDLRKRTPELSVSAKCILGLCVGYEILGYADVRPFQYLGTGAFMIMRKYPEMEHIIPDDIYVPFHSYNDPYVVKNLWDEWKNRDTTDIRRKAFNWMQNFHNCEIRVKHELEVLEGKRNGIPLG